MKAPPERTKVVIRHLPPSLVQSDLLQQIDDHFAGRFNWFSFRPGKTSYKHQKYSRAYINFNSAEDVFEFAEFFDGHVFVNEKGAQHKAIVEYSPSQRVPKSSTKKDGREGTIYKDPDYLEFLKLIAKPPEHLPSAEIQLERKEAEQAGAAKEAPIVTPLMEYIRQKRAVESGAQASPVVTKISRRTRGASSSKPGSENARRGSEKKKYVQKNSAKSSNRKDKSSSVVIPRREYQSSVSISKGISEIEAVHGIEGPISAIPLPAGSGKKKILLVKGKEREILNAAESMAQQQNVKSGNPAVSAASKQNPRREASGRLIRSILLNNEARQSQSTTAAQQKVQILSSENGKRPLRNVSARSGTNGLVSNHDAGQFNSEGDSKRALDEKFVKRDLHGLGSGEKTERRTRNKDRPDCGVWTPLRRSDVSHAVNEHSSSSVSQSTLSHSESVEGEMKDDVFSGSRKGEYSASAGGRNSSSVENGSQRHYTRRGATHTVKDDTAVSLSEAKPSKKGVAGHGAHEKQVWVQKSSSGS
ncbi:regulator of nonsense transcripts UPF3 [Prosopis cineraria]|uniref:regulator of nonsense transcripts UPF3 n=1 Tax=Prosopis cineraria TaxID=364024 RepID=UPI0024109781|nr:regulator of nonsense transcripts UPF3 [Prosopis cineraria]XP_054812017.1 regulator of nonsense transcripts UPF3 [Prosopis cineraria]XP_054812018.1 regulator of nonsense transcripts UPF3 [Prosopis cineraria]XP_054812019.1 regulator of nonsense transcripts UPF3 [Prosopis cineraria]